MKEGSSVDHLSLAWQYPGQPRVVIPAKYSTTSLSSIWSSSIYGANLDTWTGIGGLTIADLMSGTNNLANTPNRSEFLLSVLEAPTNVGDDYGSRMSGWLVPPVTGSYEFWIASDDQGEFWLSTNDSPTNKVRQCSQLEYTSPREWDKFPEQKSSPILLVAGQAYYYEVRLCDCLSHLPPLIALKLSFILSVF
jgi:hypothetical protein